MKERYKFKDDVSETLLIPLWMRSVDPILNDTASREVVSRIDYDFDKFSADFGSKCGVRLRTLYLKGAIQSFIDRHPDAVVVMLGCGLDPQSRRVENRANATFYALDLPDVIETRKKLLPETDYEKCISASATDTGWMKELAEHHKGRDFIFIAEGLLMYLTPEDVEGLFNNLCKYFPGSEIYIERMSRFAVKNQSKHKSVSKTSAHFNWGADSPKEITALNPQIKSIANYKYLPHAPGIFGIIGKLIPPLGNTCGIWGFKL